MVQEITKSTDNIFKSHNTTNNPKADQYRSYDSTTGQTLNCSVPQKTPMQIAMENTYTKATQPSITTYKNQALGNCSKTKYSNNNTYPEINERLERDYDIFKKLYIENLTGLQNCSNLVPVVGDKTVTCPDNTVPYVLQYQTANAYEDTKFLRACIQSSKLNNISFDFDFQLYKYIEANTGTACNTNICNTQYEAFTGHNLEKKPFIKNNDEQKRLTEIDIALGASAGVVILICLIIIFYKSVKLKSYNKN